MTLTRPILPDRPCEIKLNIASPQENAESLSERNFSIEDGLADDRATIAADSFAIEIDGLTADAPAFEPGPPHAGPDSLEDQVPL